MSSTIHKESLLNERKLHRRISPRRDICTGSDQRKHRPAAVGLRDRSSPSHWTPSQGICRDKLVMEWAQKGSMLVPLDNRKLKKTS